MYTDDRISEIVSSWRIRFRKSHPEIGIDGSPERTSYRVVIEDQDSRLWVLEAIAPDSYIRKVRISEALTFLRARGLRTVHPHLPNDANDFAVLNGRLHWQMRPYIKGVPLPRPSYVLDRWRGRECARFLTEMREKAQDMPGVLGQQDLSMASFIQEMSSTMERYDPQVHKRLGPAFRFIEKEFLHIEGGLPTCFCHGDFHPLNVIWSENGIQSVIDWEFLGYKFELYDMANLIGCVGFEDPEALGQGFVNELISQMRTVGAISELSWEVLAEWVTAIRFAWLSDWLRRRDREMVDLEVAYIDLLIRNLRVLKDTWAKRIRT